MRHIIIYSSIVIFLISCQPASKEYEGDTEKVSPAESLMATPDASWIETRIDDAYKRLETNKAGQLIWEAIEAHGGLKNWYQNGPIYFRFNYRPRDDKKVRDSYQMVDTWRSTSRHQLVSDPQLEFGWDGTEAWTSPSDAEIPVNPRFWSMTPYYFVGIPFVFSDEGIHFELMGTSDFEGNTYYQVKVTYDQGIGDAPDDYYIVYIDTTSKYVGALRYIVSYEGFFPKGEHAPEKMMVFDGEQMVDGIRLPEKYRTYWWVDEEKGEYITDISLSDVAFHPEVALSYFSKPENAKVQESL